jgi:acetylcholinesterase
MKYIRQILFIFYPHLFYYLNLILCLLSIVTIIKVSTKEINFSDKNLIFKSNNNDTKANSDFLYIEHHHNYSSHRHHKNNTNRLKKSENKAGGGFDNLIVQTQSGRIRGTSFYVDEHLDNQNKLSRIDAWLGIPFAEKPIGNLRFKRPIPIKGWDDILNATELPNSCYQLRDLVFENFPGAEMWNPNTNVSEDCLYLNIWVPYPRPRNAAVMVKCFKFYKIYNFMLLFKGLDFRRRFLFRINYTKSL